MLLLGLRELFKIIHNIRGKLKYKLSREGLQQLELLAVITREYINNIVLHPFFLLLRDMG
jgi:hypothetical protein